MSKKADLLKNTLIIAAGKIATQMITFLLLPLYTAYLSPGEYGIVDLITTYVLLLVPALTLQLEMASFRFLVDARGNEKETTRVISNVFAIAVQTVIVCLLLFAGAQLLFTIPYAALVLFNVLATIFSNLFLQISRGMGDNKKFAIASIATGVTTLVSSVVLLVGFHAGAPGLLISLGLANLVCALYLFVSLKLYKYIRFGVRDTVLQKELISYSLPLVPNGVSWWAINVADRTIISVFLGVAANGIYAVANKYSAIFASLYGIFSLSWTESASMHINAKDRDAFFSETSNASVKLFGSFGLLLIAAIPLVFGVLVDPAYQQSYLYIPILVISAFFNAIVGTYSAVYVAKKLTKQVAMTSIVAAVVNILLTIIFVSWLGLYAAAISTAIAYLVMAIYRHYDSRKFVTITYEPFVFVKFAAFYAVALSLYYFNLPLLNMVNIVFAVGVFVMLNKSIVRIIKNKVLSVRRKTLPEDTHETSL